MKYNIIVMFMLMMFVFNVFAFLTPRPYRGYNKMIAASDLTVIGTVIKVQDLDETNSMMYNGAEVRLRGIETTFKVSKVFKGQLTADTITLHHYYFLNQDLSTNSPEVLDFTTRIFNEMGQLQEESVIPRGLVRFAPNNTNSFVLHLIRDGANRFAPASGQIEASYSVELEPPPWDSSFIHEADPLIREDYQVRVPTKLSVRRIKGVLSIQADIKSLEYTNLTVGTNMMMAMWCDMYVYPIGSSRPTNYCHNLDVGPIGPDASFASTLEFDMEPYYWRPDGNGVAAPITSMVPWIHTHEGSVISGEKYNVEVDLTIFETDSTKVSRSWNPQRARYYKVLWRRTLNQVVE